MARLAQGLEVVLGVGAAMVEWEDVVDFLGWCDMPGLFALLTQRVSVDVSVPDGTPLGVVAAVDLRVTLPTPVGLVGLFGVGWAVPRVG